MSEQNQKKKKYQNGIELEGWIDLSKLELRTGENGMPFMYFVLNHPSSDGSTWQMDCRVNHGQAKAFYEGEKNKSEIGWFFVKGGLIKDQDMNGKDRFLLQVSLITKTYRS